MLRKPQFLWLLSYNRRCNSFVTSNYEPAALAFCVAREAAVNDTFAFFSKSSPIGRLGMGPMKHLFDLNKLPEETEMEEVTEACQARTMFAGPGNLPAGWGDAQDHDGRSTFDMSGIEMRGTHAVPELCHTVRRREPEVSLQESAYARSWLHLIGSTSSHPGTVQIDIRQPPASAMQVGGSAEYRSSNSVLGILGTPTPLQISQASGDLPAATLRRSNRRAATRYSQSEINTLSSTKRRGRHGPKSKSSEFRGVTYYKRTRRWEAHIW